MINCMRLCEPPFGIAVCGANGCGKTTLGNALSKELKIHCMDIEEYYFDNGIRPYSNPRSRDEVVKLIQRDIGKYDEFIISAVNCNLGEEINKCYRLVVYVYAPLGVRMERIKNRSYQQFGKRMQMGGDLYEQEQRFFEFVRNESERKIEETVAWINTLSTPVLQIDGTKPIKEIVKEIIKQIMKGKGERAK